MVLASQISWSESVDNALQAISSKDPNNLAPMEGVLQAVESTLNILADSVLHEQPPVRRKKLEHLVSEPFALRIMTNIVIYGGILAIFLVENFAICCIKLIFTLKNVFD